MSVPSRLTRAFTTGLSKTEFKQRYPYLDPDETLEGFLNHHISKGDVAYDWREKFKGFADWRNRKARAEQADSEGTDSAGLPHDPIKRGNIGKTTEGTYGVEFLAAVERHMADGLEFDEAHSRAVSELEGEST
jgi:hypothetical protein